MYDPMPFRTLLTVVQVTAEGVRKNFTEVAEHRPRMGGMLLYKKFFCSSLTV